MIKPFLAPALSALIIFSSSHSEAAPRRQQNDGRTQEARARLATRLESRKQEENARQSSYEIIFEGGRKPLETPNLSHNIVARISGEYDALTQGRFIEFNRAAIESLITSDVLTFIEDTDKLISFYQNSSSADSKEGDFDVDVTNATYESFQGLPGKLKEDVLRVLDGSRAAISDKAHLGNLAELLSHPRQLFDIVFENLMLLENDLSNLVHLINGASVRLESLEHLRPPVQEDEFTALDKVRFSICFSERAIDELSTHYSFQRAAFPLICALETLTPKEISFHSFINAMRVDAAQFVIKTLEFENLVSRYAHLCQLDMDKIEDRTNQSQYVQKINREKDLAIRAATEKIDQEFWAMEGAAKSAVGQLIEQNRKNQAQGKRRRGHKSKVNRIKQVLELQRLQDSAASQSASSSGAAAAVTRQESTPITNEDAYRNWFYDSYIQFENTAKREARALAEERDSRDQQKAAKKAAKSHKIDPDKIAESSSSEEDLAEETPITFLDKTPWSRFQAFFEEADKEFTMEEVSSVILALDGYVDPRRAGSRVKIALQNPQTGHKHTRVIHDHLSNGHKGLEAGRMSSVRELFIEAGYTPDTVRCASDANSDANPDTPSEAASKSE